MINKTKQSLENRVPQDIADMKREMAALKQKQLLGADNMNIVTSIGGSLTTVYTAGLVGGVLFNMYSGAKNLYLSEVKVAFYLDNDNDDRYAWPYGANITPGMFNVSWFYDLNRSDETGAGNKSYAFRMQNTDTVSHTLYFHYTVVYPAQTLTF